MVVRRNAAPVQPACGPGQSRSAEAAKTFPSEEMLAATKEREFARFSFSPEESMANTLPNVDCVVFF
jgi:hypothetical protein